MLLNNGNSNGEDGEAGREDRKAEIRYKQTLEVFMQASERANQDQPEPRRYEDDGECGNNPAFLQSGEESMLESPHR